MHISIYLFNGFTALDAVGPYESLARLPEVTVSFCSHTPGEVRTADGFLGLTAETSIFDLQSPDVVLYPGGNGRLLSPLLQDARLIEQVRRLDQGTRFTGSVCTGAFFLAAAGLLRDRSAATHWRAKDSLAKFGAQYSGQRVTQSGKYITSAGVTAGIELGLTLCEHIAGRSAGAAVELSMEYDPSPVFGGGDHRTADAAIVELITSRLRQ
ncbi:DJ-1/PfpI family protein [Paucibacter sp. B2R-40]|uniref:DJ-1/PfpI family protein n=1 Tax=Paucibacter sp. B2R-40 TaxID=2893554 RepID=UPI0021E4A41F|nr:DJ-1/PfpI family protein [Paucibacter sp. B2R-40]MCV2357308.1 DJ-1/PfpI family protein [Paucibacter sp. B2R-40]